MASFRAILHVGISEAEYSAPFTRIGTQFEYKRNIITNSFGFQTAGRRRVSGYHCHKWIFWQTLILLPVCHKAHCILSQKFRDIQTDFWIFTQQAPFSQKNFMDPSDLVIAYSGEMANPSGTIWVPIGHPQINSGTPMGNLWGTHGVFAGQTKSLLNEKSC